MAEAVAFGRPDEGGHLGQEMQVVVQVDPGFAGLGQQRAGLAVLDVGDYQFQRLLISALTLKADLVGIG